MEDTHPRFLYKYRSISTSIDKIVDDHAIKALLGSYAVFSSRKNFNDLFDSKIELNRPTTHQFKIFTERLDKEDQANFGRFIRRGQFTAEGENFLEKLTAEFNALIDSYPFFSTAKSCVSNLMWAHYADSHKGFCIEFRSEHLRAERVRYTENIASLELMDLCKHHYIPPDDPRKRDVGERVRVALHTKLKEWDYECEYRVLASNAMGRITANEKFITVDYESTFVESVIFGCRMDDAAKEFIVKNMPYPVKFKQAKIGTSSIYVVNSPLQKN